MNEIRLTQLQRRKLWALFTNATQGSFGVLYDEDHRYDEEFEKYIAKIEDILNAPKKLSNLVVTVQPNAMLSENEQ